MRWMRLINGLVDSQSHLIRSAGPIVASVSTGWALQIDRVVTNIAARHYINPIALAIPTALGQPFCIYLCNFVVIDR